MALHGMYTGLALAALALVSACDPCAGTAKCSAGPYLAVDGRIVDAIDGTGVEGVHIDVIRQGGIAVERDSLSTVTNDGGHWRVQFTPSSAGSIITDVVVKVANGATYRVKGVELKTADRGGDATVLERWVANPYFSNVGEVFLRGTPDERVGGAKVIFQRTSGAEIFGPGTLNGTAFSGTDASGRFQLFDLREDGVFTSEVSEVVGDLTIQRSATESSVIRNFRIRSTYIYRQPQGIIRIGIGPSLAYQGEFYSRATGDRVGGVLVEFERTGGVDVVPQRFTTTSQSNGRFSFVARPLTSGTVQGRLIVRAPIPSTPETLSVSLNTFEADGGQFYGLIAIGAYLPYYGIVLGGPVGLDGVKVDVTRVGGIPVAPGQFTFESYNGGIFALQPAPLALGDVIVDLSFRPPPPYMPFSVKGVRLSTSDRTVPDRLVGVFSAPRAP